ncbi:hypothetical protein KI387_009114 [Taxus chinensis]|uniref:Cysteine proteinase inhibitor n=1 Tax=Taxus chinensis TaxID=29808 RepID=A0AA38CPV7_TAXCH|nr:hypothetical protein KI387_009114 [Taxus chinensis]
MNSETGGFVRRFWSDTAFASFFGNIPDHFEDDDISKKVFGGRSFVYTGDKDIQEAARFAVQEFNKQQRDGIPYEFKRVLKAKEQVVAGFLYHLTMEVKKEGQVVPLICKAKVVDQAWLKSRELVSFEFKNPKAKVKPDCSCITPTAIPPTSTPVLTSPVTVTVTPEPALTYMDLI